MGVFSANLQARSTTTNAASTDLATIYNGVTAAMLGCGMLRVDASLWPGQAGTFVVGTAGADQTAVVAPTATTGNTSGRLDGVNLFKHPTLDLYVLVYYRWQYSSGGSWQHMSIGMEIGTAISAGAFVNGKSSGELFPLGMAALGMTTANLPATPYPLVASCGPDHFWIHHVGSVLPNAASSDSARSWRPDRAPMIGIGVFQSDVDTATFMAVMPPGYTGAYNTTGQVDAFTLSGVKAWRVFAFNKGVFETHQPGSAGYVIDPATPSSGDGVRVVRATKYIGGKLHAFNFAFMVRTVVVENTDYQLNVLGTGVKTYRSCMSMGPCSPMFSWQLAANEYSVPVFPWNV